MTTIELKATRRHLEGKKVQQLRDKGITPAHLFGPGIGSEAIQVDTTALRQTLAEAGHTRLVTLHLGHEKSPRTVMVREIQFNNRNNKLVHVDFYQVNLTENIKVEVPIILIGESVAAKAKGNTLVQELNFLTVQCLPTDIPSSFEVDIAPLITAESMIRVRDIQIPKAVTVMNDTGVVIARIAVEKAEVEKPKEEAAAEGAEATAEGTATDEKKSADKAEKKA
ncbi:MAG: 50S ribosomal protein L25 [Dehalococcoidales bacterium]|nr:50S ribosomal protein L25 [Dehalococcoidales bacterium]